MYLMGFASNPGVRPTGNLELVELSLGNKYHPPEVQRKLLHCSSNGKYSRVITTATTAMETSQSQSNCNSNSNSNRNNITSTSNGAGGSPRKAKRVSLEDLPAEPLSPVVPTERWVPSAEEEETPVNWLQEDLAAGQLAQEWWSFCIGKPKNDAKKRNLAFTSTTFESVFADGGISIRVEHHPLESSSSSSEDEFEDARDDSEASEQIGSGDEGYEQLLQHLESIEKAKVVPLQQEGDDAGEQGYAELLQHLESIERAKVSELQQESDVTGEDLRRAQVPIPSPKSTAFSPSLLSPILEKMEAYSWSNNGFLADEKCGNSNDLSSEMSTAGGDRDVEKTCKHSPTNVDALLKLKALDLYSRRRGDTKISSPKVIEVHVGEVVESQQDYPSPSSFTCGMSFTSLFSDDEDPFPLSVSNNKNDTFHAFDKHFCSELVNPHGNQRNGSSRKSPRSVLSQVEPDEISHGTSDSSETATKKLHPRKQKQQHQQVFNYMYNDESSDLDSPMQSGFKYELPFPAAFIYEASMDMGATTTSDEDSSDEDEDEDHVVVAAAGSLQELGIFQEANEREPWLVNDRGGVLDDSEEDLEFLLSPTSLHTRSPLRNGLPSLLQNLASQKMPETADGRIKHGSPKTIDGTPKTYHESPKTHPKSPKTHPDPESPKTHPRSPKTEHESPKTHHESPKTRPESPKTHPESPRTEHESLKSKDETLKTKYESASSKQESPKTKDETLKTKYDRSKVKREGPKTKPESPKTKHGSPKTKDENPKTKYEGPSTKHDSMRRPISDNKWVPYVTSRLYDDSSPRAQRNPIKRPQNLISDNPAYGGKTSVTKGEFDKAPKRSVNFAVDLVKEIPYTTTPTTNFKQNVVAPPTKRPWEVEEEEGPSIMTSHRNRWRRNRDNVAVVDDSKSNSNSNSKTTTPSPGGSTRWSTWTKERVAHAVPSCTGKLLSWPKKLAFKVSNSKRWNVDSDEDSFVGDGSFGVSARRDAELVRRILKGSQKKYSNLNETEIMRGDFR